MSEDDFKRNEQAVLDGLRATSKEDAAGIYEKYLKAYPLGVGAIPMMSRLALTYADLNRFDDAEKMLNDAIVLAGNDRFVNILKVDLACVHMSKGDLALAESELRRIAELPISEIDSKDPYNTVPQAFVAPVWLAEVYKRQGRIQEADDLLMKCADTALAIYAGNKECRWAIGYYANAYAQRISIRLEAEDTKSASELLKEMRKNIPSWTQESIKVCGTIDQALRLHPKKEVNRGT